MDFDDYDGLDDPDDGLAEDQFYEEADDLDMEGELPDEPADVEPEGPEPSFDLGDAFIIGGMIGGMAYEEAAGEKEQRERKRRDEDR